MAHEVKALANEAEAATATAEITRPVEAVQADIGAAIEAVLVVSERIRDERATSRIAAAVEEQSASLAGGA